jgi:hypothetical protein
VNRLYRLGVPAVAALVVGAFVAIFADWFAGEMRGGLTAAGVFALMMQAALAALGVAAIDDIRSGNRWSARRTGLLAVISARPVAFRQSLRAFYLEPFLPPALLAAGVGLAVFAVVQGVSPGPTARPGLAPASIPVGAVALTVVALLGGAALLTWGTVRAYLGLVVGLAAAAEIAQVQMASVTAPAAFAYWPVVAGVLAVAGVAVAASRRWWTAHAPG